MADDPTIKPLKDQIKAQDLNYHDLENLIDAQTEQGKKLLEKIKDNLEYQKQSRDHLSQTIIQQQVEQAEISSWASMSNGISKKLATDPEAANFKAMFFVLKKCSETVSMEKRAPSLQNSITTWLNSALDHQNLSIVNFLFESEPEESIYQAWRNEFTGFEYKPGSEKQSEFYFDYKTWEAVRDALYQEAAWRGLLINELYNTLLVIQTRISQMESQTNSGMPNQDLIEQYKKNQEKLKQDRDELQSKIDRYEGLVENWRKRLMEDGDIKGLSQDAIENEIRTMVYRIITQGGDESTALTQTKNTLIKSLKSTRVPIGPQKSPQIMNASENQSKVSNQDSQHRPSERFIQNASQNTGELGLVDFLKDPGLFAGKFVNVIGQQVLSQYPKPEITEPAEFGILTPEQKDQAKNSLEGGVDAKRAADLAVLGLEMYPQLESLPPDKREIAYKLVQRAGITPEQAKDQVISTASEIDELSILNETELTAARKLMATEGMSAQQAATTVLSISSINGESLSTNTSDEAELSGLNPTDKEAARKLISQGKSAQEAVAEVLNVPKEDMHVSPPEIISEEKTHPPTVSSGQEKSGVPNESQETETPILINRGYRDFVSRPTISSRPAEKSAPQREKESEVLSRARGMRGYSSDIKSLYQMFRDPGGVGNRVFNNFRNAIFKTAVQDAGTTAATTVATTVAEGAVSTASVVGGTTAAAGGAVATGAVAAGAETALGAAVGTGAAATGKVVAGVAVKGAVTVAGEAAVPVVGWAALLGQGITWIGKGGITGLKKLLSGFYDKAKNQVKKKGMGGGLGGIFGGLLGAAIGSILFPGVGTVIGGIVGGLGGNIIGDIGGKLIGFVGSLFNKDGWKKVLGMGAVLTGLLGGVGTSSMVFFSLGGVGLILLYQMLFGDQFLRDSAFIQPAVAGPGQSKIAVFTVVKTVDKTQVANNSQETLTYTLKITPSSPTVKINSVTDEKRLIGKTNRDSFDKHPLDLTKARQEGNTLVLNYTYAIPDPTFNDSNLINTVTVEAIDSNSGEKEVEKKETQTASALVRIGNPPTNFQPYGYPSLGSILSLDSYMGSDFYAQGRLHWSCFTSLGSCTSSGTGAGAVIGGIDISGPSTEVVSTVDGKVLKAGFDGSGVGGYVHIQGGTWTTGGQFIPGPYIAEFLHLNEPTVKADQRISRGQSLGQTYPGSLPTTTGPHVHYQVLLGSSNVNFCDPDPFVKGNPCRDTSQVGKCSDGKLIPKSPVFGSAVEKIEVAPACD